MKRLLCLLLMVASTSCEKERLPQNFLEKYHNSFWLADDGGDQNIGFYDDPLHFVYTAYCTRAGFGDFTTYFRRQEKTLEEVCSESQPLF